MIQQIGLFPHRTISQNIATVPGLLGWDAERARSRSAELLGLVGLDPELGDRYPAQLSGGQQQRVGVARALAANPGVMLMDEPFGAVDPINRERLQNEFLRLQAELRKTILFVTHDIDEAIKMGDRIAVMREGGRVAQYATPAELLMAPADGFVEDFVGADRALKRLALMRVSDIDLWQAPLAYVGQATGEVRAKLDGAEVPHALVIDAERRPLGWLSDADLDQPTVPKRPDTSPDPVLDLNDVMRDALSDLLQAETRYAPVVDGERRIAGVLSVEIISEFLTSRGGAGRGAPGGRAPARVSLPAALAPALPIAQQGDDFVRDPGEASTECVAANDTVCLGWAVENIDRYVTPTLEHLVLVVVPVAIGFAIALALAIVSHRRRWLVPAFTGATGVIYTIPSIALFLILLPVSGRGTATAIIALTLYTLQILYRNIVTGLANVPGASRDAGRGMGMTARQLLWRVELPLAMPEIIAGLRIATVSTVAIATLAVFAGAGGLGAEVYGDLTFKTGIVVCFAIVIGMAIAFDVIYLAAQRLLSPWRQVRRHERARDPRLGSSTRSRTRSSSSSSRRRGRARRRPRSAGSTRSGS